MEFVKGPTNSNEETLTRLVAQYEVTLLHTCYMYLRDRGLAEDATQETFLKAYKALDSFRGESSEKTWLMRIAMNTCRDIKRNVWFRFVDQKVELDQLPLPAPAPEFGEADDLAQAILQLPARHKEVILLYYYQDMTMQETAKLLKTTPSNIAKRLDRARTMLRKELEVTLP